MLFRSIRNHTGQVIAAFALTGDTERIESSRKEIIGTVRDISRVISSRMGWGEE